MQQIDFKKLSIDKRNQLWKEQHPLFGSAENETITQSLFQVENMKIKYISLTTVICANICAILTGTPKDIKI